MTNNDSFPCDVYCEACDNQTDVSLCQCGCGRYLCDDCIERDLTKIQMDIDEE